ncbi:hypothetical protein SAMN05216559_3890 [Halomicrobium zhouii]|uniref:Polyprenyl synthetase n=1 Tax=Halomicrobium zhouii TaxID=767519 RepID=A0A1I6M778_9EURY|nr:hypothetical protein [Halomicrobium zhouii]SFS11537.1 hypothetical protein SAMN05216559_3890 [Halomicrobium zhouii]
MEEAAAVRRAALAAVEDVEPDRLHARIEDRLDTASVTPGVLTLASARAVREESVERLSERAAGVQLIYEGLGLTRTLAHEDPWADADVRPAENGHDESASPASQTQRDEADLDILIADILVSRGFYLLARTEAAEAAVAVVRAFGTDQTVRRVTGDDSPDTDLEADVLELAVVAGTTAAGGRAPARLREYATELAADGLPPVDRVAEGDVLESLGTLAGTEPPASDGVRTSADH